MTYSDKNIVKTYSKLFEGLSAESKKELIDNLSKSLKTEEESKEEKFYRSFGAFGSGKSAEEIVSGIKSGRKFRTKEFKI